MKRLHVGRLRVDQRRVTRRAVPNMPHGEVPRHGLQVALREDLTDETHPTVKPDQLAIMGCNSSGLLTAMLKRIQREERQLCCGVVAVLPRAQSHHPTCFSGSVERVTR